MNDRSLSSLNSRDAASRCVAVLLVLFVAADLAFIVLHVIHKMTPHLRSTLYSIERDRGYAEFFQYAKYFWMLILVVFAMRAWRSFGFLSWFAIIAYLLCDDAFTIHENLGRTIAAEITFQPPMNLRRQDFGELAVYASAGLILVGLLAATYRWGTVEFRRCTRKFLGYLAALVFFGVIVDMIHETTARGTRLRLALAIIEEGGEMIVASFMLCFIFSLTLRDRDRPSL